MKKFKRVFVIVADSLGVGYQKDAKHFFNGTHNDFGSNTLLHISEKTEKGLNIPCLNSLGIGDLDSIKGTSKVDHPHSFVMKSNEKSNGKDTMTGHWEMMGIHTTNPFLTFTDNGFPDDLINELEEQTGHKIIGNKAASGTEILKELGEEQIKNNSLIVYTSADSVLQIAAHEEFTGLEELYRCCEIARKITMKEKWMVGRVIARPYIGTNKNDFKRVTGHRHDLALRPSEPTVMNLLKDNGLMVDCIGKINDIFDGYGVVKTQKTVSNTDGMDKTIFEIESHDFSGLCFVNLVEFDSEFGHRRDSLGYAKAIEEFDLQLKIALNKSREDDLIIVCADHGNDPTWFGTDHTREKVPFIIYSKSITNGKLLSERNSFADIGATILHNFNIEKPKHLLGEAIKELFE